MNIRRFFYKRKLDKLLKEPMLFVHWNRIFDLKTSYYVAKEINVNFAIDPDSDNNISLLNSLLRLK